MLKSNLSLHTKKINKSNYTYFYNFKKFKKKSILIRNHTLIFRKKNNKTMKPLKKMSQSHQTIIS